MSRSLLFVNLPPEPRIPLSDIYLPSEWAILERLYRLGSLKIDYRFPKMPQVNEEEQRLIYGHLATYNWPIAGPAPRYNPPALR